MNDQANATPSVNPDFRRAVDAKLDSLIDRFYRTVPFARHQLESRELSIEYYKRHTMETILRIRRKRTIDALVIHYFTKHDPRQAKAWAQYTEEEMLHDALFAKDLERLGVTPKDIYNQEPFLATKLLNGYFYYTLEYEGPLASIASAYFLEYTTRKTQPAWIENLEQVLGKDETRGARTHVSYDIGEEHTHFVWNVLMSLVRNSDDEKRVLMHMNNWYALFCAYFNELYHSTIGGDSDSAMETPSVVVRNAAVV